MPKDHPVLARITLSLPRALAERLSDASKCHNVSGSALAEVLLLYALEQLSAVQLRGELERRGASLRRTRAR